MSVKNIIFSIILHSLVIYFIFTNIAIKKQKDDNELHIKVEIAQQDKSQIIDYFDNKKTSLNKSIPNAKKHQILTRTRLVIKKDLESKKIKKIINLAHQKIIQKI